MQTQEISQEVLELAQKLAEAQKAKLAKTKENLKEKYPWIKEETLRYDGCAGKNSVEMDCVQCRKTHRRYTSDLFQTLGLCPECRASARKKAKALRAEQVAAALKFLAEKEVSS
jgi:acetyl-CoA carboxylase beta subunit